MTIIKLLMHSRITKTLSKVISHQLTTQKINVKVGKLIVLSLKC